MHKGIGKPYRCRFHCNRSHSTHLGQRVCKGYDYVYRDGDIFAAFGMISGDKAIFLKSPTYYEFGFHTVGT